MSALPGVAAGPTRRSRRFQLRRLASRPAVFAALVFVGVVVVVAILAPWVAPYDPNAQDLSRTLEGPSADHLLGTDGFGRDALSRVIFGARVSMFAAVEALLVAALLGAPLGLIAGNRGGRVDAALSRLFDSLMSVPALILALTIVAVLGPGLTKAMFAVGVIFAPRYFRVARAVTINVRQETFIEAAVAMGCSTPYILTRHVLPNVLAPLVVQGSILLGAAVTAEASLSFLGLGVRPPAASWGSMLATSYATLAEAPLLVWAPGVMITLTVLAFTVIGEGASAFVTARSGPRVDGDR